MPPGALDGLRVLDLSSQLSGPYCTMLLGDLGADVVKVEQPGGGDPARQMGPHVGGESAPFMTFNRNKRSLTLDLKAADGRAIGRALAARADVVVESWRPGAAARLGLGRGGGGAPPPGGGGPARAIGPPPRTRPSAPPTAGSTSAAARRSSGPRSARSSGSRTSWTTRASPRPRSAWRTAGRWRA